MNAYLLLIKKISLSSYQTASPPLIKFKDPDFRILPSPQTLNITRDNLRKNYLNLNFKKSRK